MHRYHKQGHRIARANKFMPLSRKKKHYHVRLTGKFRNILTKWQSLRITKAKRPIAYLWLKNLGGLQGVTVHVTYATYQKEIEQTKRGTQCRKIESKQTHPTYKVSEISRPSTTQRISSHLKRNSIRNINLVRTMNWNRTLSFLSSPKLRLLCGNQVIWVQMTKSQKP